MAKLSQLLSPRWATNTIQPNVRFRTCSGMALANEGMRYIFNVSGRLMPIYDTDKGRVFVFVDISIDEDCWNITNISGFC